MLSDLGMGFTGLALGAMLADDGIAADKRSIAHHLRIRAAARCSAAPSRPLTASSGSFSPVVTVTSKHLTPNRHSTNTPA